MERGLYIIEQEFLRIKEFAEHTDIMSINCIENISYIKECKDDSVYSDAQNKIIEKFKELLFDIHDNLRDKIDKMNLLEKEFCEITTFIG